MPGLECLIAALRFRRKDQQLSVIGIKYEKDIFMSFVNALDARAEVNEIGLRSSTVFAP